MTEKLLRSLMTIMVAVLALSAGAFSILYEPAQDPDYGYRFSASARSGKDTVITGNGEEASAVKSETVYTLLDHSGSVRDTRIVNRIYSIKDPSASYIVDYGSYLSINNMVSPDEPILEEGRLLWDSALLDGKTLYYEGAVDKSLPVSITIEYYLDGEPISAASAAGQSGRLELLIRAQNNLRVAESVSYLDFDGNLITVEDTNYVPLLVQGTLDADLNRFSGIDGGEGIEIITGQNASINFMLFPYPEAEITISMDGLDIELDKISFVVNPGLPPLPEVDIEDDLKAMLEGISLLSNGLRELSDGADQLLKGMNRFQDESGRMAAGAEEIADLIARYQEFNDRSRNLMDSPDQRIIIDALSALQRLLMELEKAPDSAAISREVERVSGIAAELNDGIETLDKSLDFLENTGPSVKHEAERLVEENEEGTSLHNLGVLLLEREKQVESALAGRNSTASNLERLSGAADILNSEWDPGYLSGLQALMEVEAAANGDITGMLEDFIALTDEFAGYGEYLERVDSTLARAEEMSGNLALMPEALRELTSGQARISEGLKELSESGVMVIERGLIEGINESRFGKAKLELMQKLADDYRSFANNEHNRHSEVQFIMQTPALISSPEGIEQNDTEDKVIEEKHWAERIWSRLVNLFT